MSLIQGRDISSIADLISQLPDIKDIYVEPLPGPISERTKENLDELLNFIKLKHYLLDQGYRSFHLKIAPNTYYTWELGVLIRTTPRLLASPLH